MDPENEVKADTGVRSPGYRVAYNVHPAINAINMKDKGGNPSGGGVSLIVGGPEEDKRYVLVIHWQDGPRGQEGTDELLPPNGAFVEDVLWAALQRLEFFNESKYRDRANSLAITHIEQALQALKDRQLERSHRNVEGKHEV